jgi:cytochrome c oxidase subunit 2
MKHLFPALLALAVSSVLLYPSAEAADPAVIKVTAKCFAYTPSEIKLKKGVPVTLQLTTADKAHGFSAPDLNLDTAIKPGKIIELHLTPDKVGSFPFYCDVFCGTGHDNMSGKIIVTE